MANLDTRNKRGSSISKLGIIIIYPNADDNDAEDAQERMQTVGLYAGISPAEAGKTSNLLFLGVGG